MRRAAALLCLFLVLSAAGCSLLGSDDGDEAPPQDGGDRAVVQFPVGQHG